MTKPNRILIVEDVATDAELAQRTIRQALKNCDFQVVTTRKDFLTAVETFQPDVILSDYALPSFNGITVLKLAAKHAPRTPVIIWTGTISEDVAVDCMRAGANNYILKENLQRLVPAVVHALDEKELLVAREQAEEKYQAIFENSVVGIFQSTPEGRYLRVNSAMARIYGYDTPDEMLKSVQDIKHQIYVDAEQRKEFISLLHAQGIVEHYEQRNYRKDGSVFWTSTSARVVREMDGTVLYYEGFVTDITEHKQHEAALQNSEKRYRALFDDLPIPIWEEDFSEVKDYLDALKEEGIMDFREYFASHPNAVSECADRIKVLAVNRATLQMFQASDQAELLAQTNQGLSESQLEYLREGFISIVEGKTRFCWEGIDATVPGRAIKISITASVTPGYERDLSRVIVAFTDITDLKQAEEALRNSEKRFRALIENGLDDISLLAEDGTLLWESPSTVRNLGYAPDEFLNRNIFEIMHPEDLEWTRDLYVRLLQEPGSRQSGTFRLRRSDGTWRWVEAVVTNMLEEPSVNAMVVNYRDITERKQVEERINELLTFNEKIIHHSATGILTYKVTGQCVFANETAASIIGTDVAQLIAQNFRAIEAWKKSGLYKLVEQAITTQTPAVADIHHISTFGKEIWMTVHCSTFKSNGEDHLLVSISDITERKQAEEKLRRSENRYRLATQATNDIIWESDLEAKQLFWSENARVVLGYAPEEIEPPETWWDDHLHPDDRERVLSKLNAIIEGKETLWSDEYRFLHKNGSYAHISDRGYIERGASGSPLRMLGAMSDITERKRAEEALRESENRLILALSGAQMSVWEWNLQTNSILWSPEFFEITGLRQEEFGGTFESFTDLIHKEDVAHVMAAAEKAVSGNALFAEEFRIIRPDGEVRWLSNLGHAEYDQTGTHLRLIGTVQDVTQRKQAEIERQALFEIMQGLANTKDLQELLKLIHHAIAQVIYAENFFIVMYQSDTGLFEEIYSVDQYDPPEPPAKLENSITSYVFRSGEPLLLTQLLFDELVEQGEMKLVGTDSASWLGVPLKSSGRTIGVMAVQDYETDHRYSERDKDFLTSIAAQIALVIERRQAEEALTLFRSLIDHINDAIEVVDPGTGRFIDVNERACQEHGYTREEYLALTVDAIDPSVTLPPWPSQPTGSVVFESTHRRKDGSMFPVEVNLNHIRMDRAYNLAVVRDITERKRVEQALRESEEHYRAIFEGVQDAIFVESLDGKILMVNQRACEMFGYSQAEFLTKTVSDIVPEGYLVLMSNGEDSLLTAEPRETSNRRANGEIFPIEISGRLQVINGEKILLVVVRDITERKRAEEAIRQSESRYRSLVENQTELIVRWKPDGTRTFVNEAYCRYFGLTPEEAATNRFVSLVVEADRQAVEEKILHLVSGETNIETDIHRVIKMDGSIGWQEWTDQAIRDGSGNLIEFQSVGRDITERKRAEESLREAETKYRTLVEQLPAVTYLDVVDPTLKHGEFNTSYISPQVEGLLGYSPETFRTDPGLWTRLIHPDDRERVLARINDYYRYHDFYSDEYRMMTRKGDEIWVRDEAIMVHVRDDQCPVSQGVVFDITQHKRAETALIESNAKFRTLFEASPDAIILIDQRGDWTILDCNSAACQMNGYTREELIGKPIDLLNLEPSTEEGRMAYLEKVREAGVYHQEAHHRHKNGTTFPVDISTSLITLGGREVILGIDRDITERKHVEQALMESTSQFRTLFESSPEAIMLLDPHDNWSILDCNTAACQMNGYRREELIGQCIDILNLTQADPAERMNYMERVRQEGILRYETAHRRKDGTMITVEVSTSLIQFGSRDIILGIDRDITARKEAEAALRFEKERLESIAAAVPGIIGSLRLRPDGSVCMPFASPAIQDVYGFSPQEVEQDLTPFFARVHPEDLSRVNDSIRESARTMLPWYSEFRFLHPAKGEVWIEGHSVPLKEPDGSTIWHGFIYDVTERKRAEAELRASEERFRQLADNIQEVFWMTDATTGNELYMSPAAESVWGRPTETFLSEPNTFIESVFPEDRAGVLSNIEKEKNGEKVEMEYRIVRPNGSLRWVRDRAFPIFDETGSVRSIAGISADITERREAELALVKSQSRYRELFDSSPVPIWEEDYSLVKKEIDMLLQSGVIDLEEYLSTHPDEVERLASLAIVTDANNGALEFYHVEKKDVLLKGLTSLLSKDALGHFKDEILGLTGSSKRFMWEGTNRLRDGRQLEVIVTGSIPHGYEEDWSKVIISISDITERKRAEEQIRRRVKETATLLETSLALTNLDLKAILATIGNSAKGLFAADGCRIFLMEPDGETMRCVLALQESLTAFSNLKVKVGEGVTGAVAASGRAEIVNEMQNDPRSVQVPGTLEEQEAIMFAPLKERDRTLGVLSIRRVGSDRPFQFSDLELLEALASMAAAAVSNARLFEEAQRRLTELEALYENGLAVGRLLQPKEIGNRVIETFARYLPWHHVTIRLGKDQSDDLELVAFNLPNLQQEERTTIEQRFIAQIHKIGQGLSGWVIQTGKLLRTGNVHAYPQYIETHPGIRSGLYIPLRIGDSIIGVISVESEMPDAFTEQDERLLTTLANQSAIAFENARLYETLQKELLERKKAEEALRSSETHYRELADSIADILFELDQDLHYTYWNKASEIFSGISAEHVIGKSMRQLFGESEVQLKREEIYRSVLKERRARTFEMEVVSGGQNRALEVNAYPSARGVSVVAKDVTDRKRSEIIMQKRFELIEYSAHHTLGELMQRTVDEVSELTRSSLGFFHFVEEDQNTLGTQTWSTNALRLFNVPINVGTHLALDQAGLWAQAVRERQPLIQNDYEAIPEKKGLPQGHVPITREIVIPIVRSDRVMAVMGIGNKPQEYAPYDLEIATRLADYAWDITERKQMEMALETERNQLAQRVEERTADLSRANSNLARALRVKDEFLANMSHELRTPLNAILGLSESLGEQIAGPLNEKQQKYISTISESGHHLLALINDILDLAKIEAGQITLDINKVDIYSVCQASLRMIKQLAQKKNQEVVLEVRDSLGLMWADERRLKQMIVNLLGNAVKFTPENGRLGLEVHGDQEANKITFTVWDNGIGIREDDLARLFQPFVQLDSGLAREATGTGLGLALVAQMARLHGGSVSAFSEPGKGSRFSIVLPWEPASAVDSATHLRSTGKFPAIKPDQTNKPRILLVEDTKEVVMMIRDYLELAGFNVVTAQDGVDAIVQAKLTHPDLILMDIQMPRMDGLEATRRLRSEPAFKHTPVIALTALAMPSDRDRCLAAGMNEYISKPVNLKALVRIIQSFLVSHEGTRAK